MKVKILASTDGKQLEGWINEFIKDKMCVDIRFNSVKIPNKNGSVTICDRVLISYEDFEDCEPLKKHKVTAEDILGEAFLDE